MEGYSSQRYRAKFFYLVCFQENDVYTCARVPDKSLNFIFLKTRRRRSILESIILSSPNSKLDTRVYFILSSPLTSAYETIHRSYRCFRDTP